MYASSVITLKAVVMSRYNHRDSTSMDCERFKSLIAFHLFNNKANFHWMYREYAIVKWIRGFLLLLPRSFLASCH